VRSRLLEVIFKIGPLSRELRSLLRSLILLLPRACVPTHARTHRDRHFGGRGKDYAINYPLYAYGRICVRIEYNGFKKSLIPSRARTLGRCHNDELGPYKKRKLQTPYGFFERIIQIMRVNSASSVYTRIVPDGFFPFTSPIPTRREMREKSFVLIIELARRRGRSRSVMC